MSVQRLSGSWSGVCPHGLARLVNGTLIVSRHATPTTALWKRDIGAARNVDCWSHEDTGVIRVGYTNGESGRDAVRVIAASGDYVSLGFGKSIHVRRKDGRWVAMVSRGNVNGRGHWQLLDIDAGTVLREGFDVLWSSLGIIDIRPDWTPVWAYTHQWVGPVKLEHARTSGDWRSGQGSKPSSLLVAHRETVGRLLLGEARDTKVCALPDGRAAVISRVEQGFGVAFALLSPADVAALPAPTAPPPPEIPDDDDEDDDPMTEIQLQRVLKAIADSEKRVIAAIEAQPAPAPQPDPEPEPEPPPSGDAPVIDLRAVNWLHTDVTDWAETSRIDHVGIEWPKNGDTDNGTVCFPHTKAGQWPTFDNGTGEGNVWVFGFVNGQWHAATAEWLKPNQTCKRFSNRTEPDSWGIGPHTKKEPLKSWGPKSGEWIGIMVSTRARDGQRSVNPDGSLCLERSNVAMVQWP